VRRVPARSGGDDIAAIFSATGQLEYLAPKADRASLSEALLQRAWARRQARSDPERALHGWPALVDRRWSLVDRFEKDGAHYVVARVNPADRSRATALSPRELEVLERAALGHSNKVIAHDLNLADSTVRVLMARAAAKLRARTRVQLIESFLRMKARAGIRGEDERAGQ
jgi:DNA-binding CsgD family transcriptional regulator